jgi:hypothetical protein
MQIFVSGCGGGPVALQVRPGDSVSSVKAAIRDRAGLPREQQRLTFGGKQLDDSSILAACNVQRQSTLYLSLRLRGGLTVLSCPVCKQQMISDAFPSTLAIDPATGAEIPGLRIFRASTSVLHSAVLDPSAAALSRPGQL